MEDDLPKPRRASVVEIVPSGIDGDKFLRGYTLVQDETGELHRLNKGGTNESKAPIGTVGYVEFRVTKHWGLWFFKEES